MVTAQETTGSAFRVRDRVRLGETDGTGHVHHANYLRYAEMARDRYLQSVGLTTGDPLGGHEQLVLAEARATYVGTLRFDDPYEVAVEAEEVTATTVALRHTIANATGARVAEIHTAHRVRSGELPREVQAALRAGAHP